MPTALDRWMAAYRHAWDSNVPDDIAALFAAGAEYRFAPWTPVARGADEIVARWLAGADEPDDHEFSWHVIGVDGARHFVQGRTVYTDGRTYENLWIIDLDPSGRATSFIEWYMESTSKPLGPNARAQRPDAETERRRGLERVLRASSRSQPVSFDRGSAADEADAPGRSRRPGSPRGACGRLLSCRSSRSDRRPWDDVEPLIRFWRLAGENDARPVDSSSATLRLLRRDPDATIIAEHGGQIVDTVIAGWDGWRAHLHRLAVHSDHRRRGIGARLLEAAERRLEHATLFARRLAR